ncbi:MAG: NAD-dependent protein deacylase [Erysipelotrichia bacterium]|nr:NAD-dependent protein deacylase [Erysipelotrichia bacterium]
MKSPYQALKKIIEDARQLVVFTGAGMSVPSGIPDFRSEQGLYQQNNERRLSPEELISHSFFKKFPEDFFAFYKEKMCYPNAAPNNGHLYFADLENKGKNVTVITQNIDDLHQKAGSKVVYELHGSVHRNYCTECNQFYNLDYILEAAGVPHCDRCEGIVKPDVVLYEEPLNPDTISQAINAIMMCDVLLIIGTSLKVYPAAGFIRYFKGRYIVVINKEATPFDNMCDLVFNEDISQVIEAIKK